MFQPFQIEQKVEIEITFQTAADVGNEFWIWALKEALHPLMAIWKISLSLGLLTCTD